ncbi:zinc-finger domain-containing protein [Bathymodiolus thermophilus thioautotrophic gill symbiont]|uniref:Zinc finger CHCC-type domain-containing protein n=1 Tax=Bathymodiolus thermophilus thioautotrophic gill symbiont TaxID=2360 RepID=A0A1J5TYF1_9GAMM|nr:zinc-finger domain-containing protein [Bathymodiolus thermophilus thioautotrophic gill symbiont]OIR25778.1 hypothetical protein BGC33_15300 [Bathymodiolus thermophilus thioautotrophic gill symbiont]
MSDFQKKYMNFNGIEVADLPVHCPPKGVKKWNMHPKVFLQFNDKGRAACPYCGAKYELM